MKKNITFILICLLIFSIYLLYINKPKDYKLEYNINSYKIEEEYNKKDKVYYINISNDETNYSFYLDKKYSIDRKIVNDLVVEVKDDYTCVKPIINNYDLLNQCYKENNYYAINYEVNKQDKIKTIDSIEIYDDNKEYYIWNGFGLEDVLTNEKYNIFKDEHYDNVLSYKIDNLIIFANYDEDRTFTKFYIFNADTKKVTSITSDKEISYDSYYLGKVKNKIYLFDRKNMHEYAVNLKKEIVEQIDKKNIGKYYDNGFKEIELSKFKYNDLVFNMNNHITYLIEDNKLYKKYNNSKNNILISSLDVKDIISYDDEIIYYLSDSSLYMYSEETGNILLLQNFEWKFSYLNRIFVF